MEEQCEGLCVTEESMEKLRPGFITDDERSKMLGKLEY